MLADLSNLALFRIRRRGGGAAAYSCYTPAPDGAGRFCEQELSYANLIL